MNKKKLYQKCLDTYGLPAQVLMLAEESSELSVASLHLLRANKTNFDNFAEEIADVELMIDEMKTYYPALTNLVNKYRAEKMKSLEGRLK